MRMSVVPGQENRSASATTTGLKYLPPKTTYFGSEDQLVAYENRMDVSSSE